jgi:hypothetical protein
MKGFQMGATEGPDSRDEIRAMSLAGGRRNAPRAQRFYDMTKKFAIIGAIVVLVLAATACGSKSAAPATVTVQQTVTTEPAPAEPQPPPPAASTGDIAVPNVVGKNHQLAQDTMQAAGLYNLDEEDATGAGRMLLWDRNWVVVRQSPAAGTMVSEGQTILLSSKKYGE